MPNARRVLKFAALFVGLVVAGLAVFVATFKPKARAASTAVVERTPERIERGRYLVEHVLGCMDCHSNHDLTRFAGPAVGPAGGGGECLGKEGGAPGRVCSPNITPDPETGIGRWTDGEIMRAIREGIDKDGKGLFPMMPYTEYRALGDEDLNAVIAYLRGLPPARNAVADSQIDFPVSFFVKMAPRPVEGVVTAPAPSDRIAYGKYLSKVSGCEFCHTPVDGKHQPIAGRLFAGGHEFKGPGGVLRSANITPHATGIGARDEAAFVGLFKAFDIAPGDLPEVKPEAFTNMPWLTRAKMTEADLGAIHAYLRTVPAVDHAVEKRPLPTLPARAGTPAAPATPPANP